MRRSGMISLASSATMVGAVTVLVAIVAVFLAYNANNGLPFVPTYRLTAQVPDAASLVPGNEVRIGGVRVGVIESIDPVQDPDTGKTVARLGLKLDESVDPLPRDSRVLVRSRSALGLKYLEITKGDSSRGYEAGSLLPIRIATPHPVELDEVLSTFDPPTRKAIQRNLVEFGDAIAGRGPDLNAAIGDLRPLFPNLRRVMANLASPRTGLDRFFHALEATASELAPVADTQAQMFVSLDRTFHTLAGVARPYIQRTISETPRTLAVGIRDFPIIRRFLGDSAQLFEDLEPGIASLRANSSALASVLEAGPPILRRAPEFNRNLAAASRALRRLSDDPRVRSGVERLTQTFNRLDPTLKFVTPAQTICNYPTLFLRNTQSMFSQGDGQGSTWQRFEAFGPPSGPNNEGSPSSAPANGGGGTENFLHVNPYPNTASPGQPRECEAGNEPYIVGEQVIGNVPGNQGTVTADQP